MTLEDAVVGAFGDRVAPDSRWVEGLPFCRSRIHLVPTMLDDSTLAIRLLYATVFGAIVGIEREVRGHRAGLRTHILVSVGACVFTLTSVIAAEQVRFDNGGAVQVDVTRIASQIVVGVGFLGGGAILRHGATIRGLTTAASLWVTAAIGLASGFGFWRGAAAAALITLMCLAGLRPIENHFLRGRRRRRAERLAREDATGDDYRSSRDEDRIV